MGGDVYYLELIDTVNHAKNHVHVISIDILLKQVYVVKMRKNLTHWMPIVIIIIILIIIIK